MLDNFLWVEKYRPKTVSECILPKHLKETFQQFVDQKNIPNLLLSGGAGCGKTTVAKAMLEELGCDYIIINGSLNGNIDTLRNEIMQFASSVSFSGGRKYVILDEADYLNANSTQPALRNFTEEFSNNCGFILTCNFKNKIIAPLHSRCSVIDFAIPKAEKAELAVQFMKRAASILKENSVTFEKEVLAEFVRKFFPDFRRVLNELQRHGATGTITSDVINTLSDSSFNVLIGALKDKNFNVMRKWIGENADIETATLYKMLYTHVTDMLSKESIPVFIIILADYQYKAAFVADPEVNNIACLAEVMAGCTFRG